MQKRYLGNSDLAITPIGIGAWAMGGAGWKFSWGPQEDADSIAAIHEGWTAESTGSIPLQSTDSDIPKKSSLARSRDGVTPVWITKCERVWDDKG